MMKRNILAVVIPALLVAGAANAAEIYNKDGNKLDLYGKVDARHQFSDNAGQDGDETYVRFGFKGETQITSQLTGYGQWEYNVQANHAESQGDKGNKTRLGFAGLKFDQFGSLDYGRNYGVIYDVNAWTDMLPVFGGDSLSNSDNFMTGRSTGLATYRNTNFFGLVDGLNFALQYQGKNEDGRSDYDPATQTGTANLKDQNGDGVGVSTTYDLGNGIHFGAGYSSSNRTDAQKTISSAQGNVAQTWNVGAKYDANNVYLAVMYAEALNTTPYGDFSNTIANKAQDIEVTAQYQFDFGLRPSLGYVQSKGKDLNGAGTNANGEDHDLVKYVSVGSYYAFNKNMTAYVDYKINLLDEDKFTRANGLNTDDVVGLGLVYQF